ncbi:MAG: ribosome biogenesis GTPase Der [Planctomycetota bacterium]|nr:MAG: ribosome biogenesis GTPase Der [Planctomycetota bacterium]GDY10919.1 GTPase Der [Planctomycetia bacterium]
MPVPQVAIIGRPNVGKSSILNWLAHKLVSVVDPTPGVTRDRVTYLMNEGDRYFELIDTGGIGIVDRDDLSEDVERQIQIGIDRADLILFVVDGKDGPMPLDQVVADRLRPINKPKLLVVNKCDSPRAVDDIPQFYRMMNGPTVSTSVIGNLNRVQLIEAILAHLPPASEHEAGDGASLASDPELKFAIVGRRNVGKSTFINALAEEERCIVSEIPGTTRDSIDVRFEIDGLRLLAIDTPGVRKKKSLANDVEFYGMVRAQKSIRRADVVFMFFDATETVSRVDKQLVDEIVSQHKPVIFVINKWDLAKEAEMAMDRWSEYLAHQFGSLKFAPVAFLTAKSGRNVHKLINLAQSIFKQARTRVSTGEINRVIRAAVVRNRPPVRRNQTPKIFFATQVATEPPTIVCKCNNPELFDNSWQRYLLSVIREELPFHEVPVKLYLRQREQAEERRSPSDKGFGLDHTVHGEAIEEEDFDDDDWKEELSSL